MKRSNALARRGILALAIALGVAGCQDKKTYVPFVNPFTPASPVRGVTPIFYTTQARADQAVRVAFEVSKDAGKNWIPATEASGGQAINVVIAQPEGATNVFYWDSFADLGPGYFTEVIVRGTGQANGATGRQGATPPFSADETGSFSATASPGVARADAAAVPLKNDGVLVAGGVTGSAPTAAVEVYDPTTERLESAPSLSVARTGLAAALLGDGRVLLAGGAGVGSTALAAVDVYSRLTNTTAPIGTGLVVARFDAGMAATGDGGAVIAGGIGTNGLATPVVEAFDARGSSAGVVASATVAAVRQPAAVSLADGRVLFCGGALGDGTATASAFVYDPTTRTIVTAGNMLAARVGHRASRLADGRVLVAGGFSRFGDAQTTLATSEVFDPKTLGFTTLATLVHARALHAQDFAGGRVVAVGGPNPAAAQSGEVYDPDRNTWSLLPFAPRAARTEGRAVATGPGRALIVGGNQVPELSHSPVTLPPETWVPLRDRLRPRAFHSATKLAVGDVVFAGGTDGITSATASTEIYRASFETFETRASMIVGRAHHASALLLDGRVLAVGGRDAQGNVLGSIEAYSPVSDTWQTVGQSLAVPRTDAHALVVPPGDVIILGGRDAQGKPVGLVEIFHPVAQTLESGGSLQTARGEDDAITTLLNRVLVAGGRDANGNPVLAVESYDPITKSSTVLGNLQSGRPGVVLGRAPLGTFVLATGGDTGSGARADLEAIDLLREPAVVFPGSLPMETGRAFHAITSFSTGVLLMMGGRSGSLVLDRSALYLQNSGAYVLNPLEAQVRETRWPHMTSPRVGHTATLLLDGRVLVLGGMDHRGVVKAGAEAFLGSVLR